MDKVAGGWCSVLLALTACGGSSRLTCGEGTVERDGECVPARSSNGGSGGVDPSSGGTDSATGGSEPATGGTATATGGGGPATGGSGPATGDAPPGATAEEVDRARAICPDPEEGVAATPTQAEFEALLVGRWLHCAGPVVFAREDTAGLRFDSDGSFAFLVNGEDGALRDGAGFDYVGTWELIDTSDFNGPGVFQLNLDMPGGGNPAFLTFATAPPKMRLSWTLGNSDYASLDPR